MQEGRSPELRELGRGDLAQAWEIERTVFASESWTKDQLEGELLSIDTYYVGAFLGPTLLGYGGIRGFYQADVMTLGVSTDWRGMGIGTRLVRALVFAAQSRGWDPVFLEVRESNRSARALYKAAGFTELGKVRAYYRNPTEDAVRMGYSSDLDAFK